MVEGVGPPARLKAEGAKPLSKLNCSRRQYIYHTRADMDTLPAELLLEIYDFLPFISKIAIAVASARVCRAAALHRQPRDVDLLVMSKLGTRLLHTLDAYGARVFGDFLIDLLFDQDMAQTIDVMYVGDGDTTRVSAKKLPMLRIVRDICDAVGLSVRSNIAHKVKGKRPYFQTTLTNFADKHDIDVYTFAPEHGDGAEILYLPFARVSYGSGGLAVYDIAGLLLRSSAPSAYGPNPST